MEDLRLLFVSLFKHGDLPVASILEGNPGEKIFKMQQPAFQLWAENMRSGPALHFFVVNALEELDEPGEWCLNRKTRAVYYYPTSLDDMRKADVFAPAIQCLVRTEGQLGKPIHHLRFEGVTFQHGQWLDPQHKMLGRSQAEIYMGDTDKYNYELPGQIIFNYAEDVVVKSCTVRHMGSCGIQTYEGCHRVLIEGNQIYDLTAAGVSIGRMWVDTEKIPADTVCSDIMIRNNLVRNTGKDYQQATGINIFAARACNIYHNDVADTAYTAIHARIGDNGSINPAIGKIEYKYNLVTGGFQAHKFGINDGGHFYMFGRFPDSEVSENYSRYADSNINHEYYSDAWQLNSKWNRNISRDSQAHQVFKVNDKKSTNMNFDENASDRPNKSFGFATSASNFHLVSDNQWPPEARKIMDNAGLEPQWRYLTNKIYSGENLTRGKRCWASSSEGEFVETRANDGMWKKHSGLNGATGDASFWKAKMDDGQSFWAVDLGIKAVIQRLTIVPVKNGGEASRRNFEVQASNDPDFKDAIVLYERSNLPSFNKPMELKPWKQESSSDMMEQYLPTVPAYRYFCVKRTTTTEPLAIAEFALYGYQSK